MPLGETMNFADIEKGLRVGVEVTKAEYIPKGDYGPQIQVDVEVLAPEKHAGEMIRSWFSLSVPRTRKVRDLRSDGFDDEAIAEALRKKGFDFEDIDEPEEPRIGGALRQALKAGVGNDARVYRALVNKCNSFDELADKMVGMRFTAAIRHDDQGRSKIDGSAAFEPYVEVTPVTNLGGHNGGLAEGDREDFDKIPF